MNTKNFLGSIVIVIAMLLSTIGARADVVIDETTFPDPAFRAYLLKLNDGNNIITDNDMYKFAKIELSDANIKSLQGIELLSNLQSLGLSLVDVKELNLSGFSVLSSVSCSRTKLESIRVSNCDRLSMLVCQENQQLISFSVSECKNLNHLECNINHQLASLNVSDCKGLKELMCNSNQLESMVISDCSSLITIHLQNNRLSAEVISEIVNSIPLIEKGVTASIVLKDMTANVDGNDITTEHIRLLKEKGWTPKYYSNFRFQEYESCVAFINDETFPDPELRAYVLKNSNGDSFLTDGEIEQFKEINISSVSITSLKGIEYLNKLERLGINRLKDVGDVDLSNFKNLRYVHLGGKMNSLNLSGCNSLRFLTCNCEMLSLNLKGCENLDEFDCSRNQLTSLDLSDCRQISTLKCGFNLFTTLDLSGYLALDILDCSNNQLVSLNLSGCNGLTLLTCDNNQLESLNLTDCKSLYTVYMQKNSMSAETVSKIISEGPDKKGVRIVLKDRTHGDDGNDITTEHLKQIKKRGWVPMYIYKDELRDYSDDDTLEDVAINEENFPDESLRNAIKSILGIDGDDYCLIDGEGAKITELSIRNCNNLKGLEFLKNLSYLTLDFANLKEISASTCPKLTKLILRGGRVERISELPLLSYIHSEGSYIAQSIQNLPSLETIEFIDPVFDTESLAITNIPQLKTLLLRDDGYFVEESSYSSPCVLKSLDVSGNPKLEQIEVYGRAISLSSLDFSTLGELKYLTMGGISSIDLSNNKKLEHLVIGYGSKLSSLDLKNNEQLTELYCDNNLLTALDLTNNTKLSIFECIGNQLTSLNLTNNVQLEELICENNQLTALDLTSNTKLVNLRCGDNQLTALDVSGNGNLQSLYCENNPIEPGELKIPYSLELLNCSGLKIKHLDLSDYLSLNYLVCRNCELESLLLPKDFTPQWYGQKQQIYCSNNQLGVDAVQSMLENINKGGERQIYFIDFYTLHREEGNAITEEQIRAFESKKSQLYYHPNYETNMWYRLEPSVLIGIEQIEADKVADKRVEGIYNLSGQRLTAPQKGLNIVNGKKVFIK